ncbi:tigger transposable element-derived protein 4-like [Euwallacea similis]|uniref:tigger transposable element-derived protein 4-like n=1 Tax=Euwallacea similis TaxID=1736056 RepID=UPI003450EEF2
MRNSMECREFHCSCSWIEKRSVMFKKHHGITSGKIMGEAAAVDGNVMDNWLQEKRQQIRENYEDSNIFNTDEMGLFYKLTPDRTLRFKGEKCTDGKLFKERITVLVAAHFRGTEKGIY